MNVAPPKQVDAKESKEQIIDEYFQYIHNTGKVDFVLAVMERKDSNLYSTIKRISERKFGVLTQCVTMKSVQKANNQLFGMILMKINAKLGGVACKVDWNLLPENRKVYYIFRNFEFFR